jgi:hypothetical protein
VCVHPPVMDMEYNSLAGRIADSAAVILGLNFQTVDRASEIICCWVDYLWSSA